QLGIALALRRSGVAHARRPRFLDVAVAGAVVLQLAPVVLPPLRTLLGIEVISLTDLLVVIVAATVPGLAVKLAAAAQRHR
ncbi:MAG: hypothetical protein ICV70_08135, partial [Jiangellaceae bacterium]|nr:hypothetical protein [Jiangellaceae bacterium]